MIMEVMEVIRPIIYLLIIVFLLDRWLNHRHNGNEEEEKEEEKEVEPISQGTKEETEIADMKNNGTNHGTRDLFLDVLTKIGCQYQLGEGEDNRIFFAYQGEHFFADTSNDILFVHIWDTFWERVELYNIDEVSRLKRAINTSNMKTVVTTVYTIDEEGKNLDVHSKVIIPFLPQIPHLEEYLSAELNDFFRAHQFVRDELRILREKEND